MIYKGIQTAADKLVLTRLFGFRLLTLYHYYVNHLILFFLFISVWLFGSACGDCLLDWFVGQNVSQETVPTYVFVKDYQDACGTVDVAYRSFYPYNYGKDVCVGKYEGGRAKLEKKDLIYGTGNLPGYRVRVA